MRESTQTPIAREPQPLGVTSARVTGFLRMIQQLSESQWLEVCRRHLADEPRLRAAAEIVNRHLRSDAAGVEERSWRMQEVTTAYVDISRALARLPATLDDGGKSLPCRGIALLAASNAVRALVVEPDLKTNPEGRAAANALINVFGDSIRSVPDRRDD